VRRHLLVVLLVAGTTGPLAGQVPDSLVALGIGAYGNLEYNAAAGYFRRALTALERTADTARLAKTLVYLGATEVFRGRPDSGRAVFGRLVRLDPRYRPDRLIFPPEITGVFDAVRRATPATSAYLVPRARFRAGEDALPGTVYASSFHEVRVELQLPDASVVRRLYLGPVADSMTITWDGRGIDGRPVPSGAYLWAVSSLDSAGSAVRILRIPLDLQVVPLDTLPQPVLAPTDLLPEQKAAGGGLESLVGGLLIGTAVAALPSAVAPDASLGAGRFAVGGAIAVAGVVGFFTGRGQRPIPENVAVNDSLRAEWRASVEAVAAENARRRLNADITVQVGVPQVVERERS
jgi:hypothetical protein